MKLQLRQKPHMPPRMPQISHAWSGPDVSLKCLHVILKI